MKIEKAITNIDKITTRITELGKFFTFNEEKIQKIADEMPAINRALRVFGRKNTQTTNKLMTLTMLAGTSPYRVIRQCLAQIENRRNALKEARFKLLKDRIKLEKLEKELDQIEDKNSYDYKMKLIRKEELLSRIADSSLFIEGALKDIASFQSAYKQICKAHNIPEDWDEKDMEQAEIKHHIRMAFLLGYRDIMAHGRLGMGTLEYLQQFGIHPNRALNEIVEYVNSCQEDYDGLEIFLDRMYEKYKDEYKKVLKRLGISNLYDDWYMYLERNKDE